MAISTSSRRTSLEADDTSGPIVAVNPEKLINEIPAGVDYRALMSDAAFMAERVAILLHPLGQQEAEPAVPVSVNGDRAYLTPGTATWIKRYHVAQLLKARPDYVSHVGGDVHSPESGHNRFFQQSTSRYNFDVVEDTPKGVAWLKELRRHYTRR